MGRVGSGVGSRGGLVLGDGGAVGLGGRHGEMEVSRGEGLPECIQRSLQGPDLPP